MILEHIALLGLKPDIFSHTSDHFELLLTYAEKMLRDGTAYVDDTEPEVMKQQRRNTSSPETGTVCGIFIIYMNRTLSELSVEL